MIVLSKLSKTDKKLLVELICHEQASIIRNNHADYSGDRYKQLEQLKVKVKSM